MGDKENMHFVLIHGACHGAWCWYKLVTLLRSNGHKVTALDMAASGVHPKRVEELNSFSDYCEPLMAFMADLSPDDRVILVGHSMGGITISLAMEKFPKKIAVAVFLTASSPGPDFPVRTLSEEYARRLDSAMDNNHGLGSGEDKPPTFLFGPKYLSIKLYQLSPPEVESIHQYIESMKTAYLADQRHRGDGNDPFLEADRCETAKQEAAARRVHPTLHLPAVLQPSTQVAGAISSSPMPAALTAPPTSTAVSSASSGSGFSLIAIGGSASLFGSTPSSSVSKFTTTFPTGAAVTGSGASFNTASKTRAKSRTGRR